MVVAATLDTIVDTLLVPRKQRTKAILESLLLPAGIEIGGSGPASVQILDESVYDIALTRGFVGLRDAYVDGLWEAERLDVITDKMLSHRVPMQWSDRAELVLASVHGRIFNRQTRAANARSRKHYDLGDDLYRAMLDPRMVYSCAYWVNAKTLAEAQEAKLDLVCRKLGLERGMRVLDIGCGWGSLAKFAAERYGVSVTGITISIEQAQLGAELCAGLPVEIKLLDYRDFGKQSKEKFDRVVSLGMLEHVGYQNYRTYMKIARGCLTDDGLFLLHTVGGNVSMKSYDSWMTDNIFPNALLPSMQQISDACEGSLIIEDWHNIGPHYDPTLMSWFQNFHQAWPRFREKYGDRFYRLWKCYLLTCAGSFRARENQVWQIVLSPYGVRGGYTIVR
jgi:cyclopropane-fatty-acyl-phospholipid synthase